MAFNVRRRRKKLGLSLLELSNRLTECRHPLSLKVLSKIENEDRSVDVDDLVALALALETTPARLLQDPVIGAKAEVDSLLEMWTERVDQRRKLLEEHKADVDFLQDRIRQLVADDGHALAALEEYWRSRNPIKEVQEALVGMFTFTTATTKSTTKGDDHGEH